MNSLAVTPRRLKFQTETTRTHWHMAYWKAIRTAGQPLQCPSFQYLALSHLRIKATPLEAGVLEAREEMPLSKSAGD